MGTESSPLLIPIRPRAARTKCRRTYLNKGVVAQPVRYRNNPFSFRYFQKLQKGSTKELRAASFYDDRSPTLRLIAASCEITITVRPSRFLDPKLQCSPLIDRLWAFGPPPPLLIEFFTRFTDCASIQLFPRERLATRPVGTTQKRQ